MNNRAFVAVVVKTLTVVLIIKASILVSSELADLRNRYWLQYVVFEFRDNHPTQDPILVLHQNCLHFHFTGGVQRLIIAFHYFLPSLLF